MSIYQDVLNAANAMSNHPAAYVTNTNYPKYTTGPSSPNSFNDINVTCSNDITVDGVSLREFMKTVTQRLNMLVPNPLMEQEWAELKALGDAYRGLEKKCLEKSRVWDILNKT